MNEYYTLQAMQPFASLLLALLVTAVCSQLPPFLTAPHYYNAEASKHYGKVHNITRMKFTSG